MSETQKENGSLSISGNDGGQMETSIIQSEAETTHQCDAEESDSTYFIPWRKHLQKIEASKNVIQEPSSPEEKLSLNPPSPPENQEDQPVNENMAVTEENLPTCLANAEVAAEDSSTLIGEVKHTVKHKDDSMQAFKESFEILQECCDNLCMGMANLQVVLEALIAILRE